MNQIWLTIQEALPGEGGGGVPSQCGRGRLSLVAISFYALLLLFGPCCLSEFTLAGPHSGVTA